MVSREIITNSSVTFGPIKNSDNSKSFESLRRFEYSNIQLINQTTISPFRLLFAPNGAILRKGETFKRPVLANTFEKIAKSGGADIFYK